MDSISFGKLYYKLLKDDLSKSSIILFTLLLSNSMQEGFAYGTNKYYAEMLNCTTRTISNLIRELESKNYLSITNPKSFRRKIYVRSEFLTK